jgi:hypothetical protein
MKSTGRMMMRIQSHSTGSITIRLLRRNISAPYFLSSNGMIPPPASFFETLGENQTLDLFLEKTNKRIRDTWSSGRNCFELMPTVNELIWSITTRIPDGSSYVVWILSNLPSASRSFFQPELFCKFGYDIRTWGTSIEESVSHKHTREI